MVPPAPPAGALADLHPGARRWVEDVVDALAAAAPEPVGVYLHGSLAQGSWRPPKSDVDLLVVVGREMHPPERERLARLCCDLSHRARPPGQVGGLELSVVRRDVLDPFVHPTPFEVHYGDEHADDIRAGRVDHGAARIDADLAAHVTSLRETGRRLLGPPVDEVFGPVPREAFVASVAADLEWILEGEHLVESPFYGVLNLCRGLWLAESGSDRLAPGKDEAGRWALTVLSGPDRGVVEDALAAYRSDAPLAPEERKTGGRSWSRDALLGFRDRMRARLPEELIGRG